jgi:hypothetical protein
MQGTLMIDEELPVEDAASQCRGYAGLEQSIKK